MKAIACRQARLELTDLAPDRPGKGQVLLRVLRCGICGSDLHARHHCDELAEVLTEIGYDDFMRSSQSVVLGHEFCGEVAEYGARLPRAGPGGVARGGAADNQAREQTTRDRPVSRRSGRIRRAGAWSRSR